MSTRLRESEGLSGPAIDPDELRLSPEEELLYEAEAAVLGLTPAQLKSAVLAEFCRRQIDAPVQAALANTHRAKRKIH